MISCPRSALRRVMALARHRDAVEIAPKDFEDQTCGILAPALWVRIQRVSARHPNEP
jgi:phage major head subunit gpT-like protein